MKNVLFVKPALETDAVWDPIRTCSYLGMWYLSSQLKLKGHKVTYLDEVVRNNGLSKRSLFKREIEEEKIISPKIIKAVDMIKSFVSVGLERTMTQFNE